MTFFFDECVSKNIAEALNCLVKPTVILHLRHEFEEGAGDAEWIPIAGENGWVIVTTDGRIRKNSAEQEALEAANVISVFIFKEYPRWGIWDQVVWMVKYWPKIEGQAKKAQRGTTFYVNARGKITEMEGWYRGRTSRQR